jgi:hypothetical protein
MPVGEAESDVAFPRLSADQVEAIAAVGRRFDLEPGAMPTRRATSTTTSSWCSAAPST